MIDEITQGGKYEPKFHLKTPSHELNQLIRGGGIQSNAIIQFQSSTEGSFKSTLALQMLAEAQRIGLNVGFIDSEHAMDSEWAEQIGVDTEKWFLGVPSTGEIAFELAYKMIEEHDCKVVVLDSIDSMQPEHLFDSELGDAHIGNHAKLHSKGVRKLLPLLEKHDAIIIGINQKKVNLTPMGARGYNATGGKSWGFYSKLIIDCKRGSANSNENKDLIELSLYVEKNKLGSSFVTVKEHAKQGYGVVAEYSLLKVCIEKGIIIKRGAWFRLKGEDEPIAQGEANAVEWVKQNKEQIEDMIHAEK